MSTDKLFILLLVVLLPLSGCLDTVEPADADSVVDADSHTHPVNNNNPPVIYATIKFTDYYDYDTSTLHEDVIVFEGMVKDMEGDMITLGLDTDLDGVIDYGWLEGWDASIWNTPTLMMLLDDSNNNWMNPIPSAQGDLEYCIQWIQLIAVDDEGAMQINPYRAIFEYDDETDSCLLERN
jgi:hypothetical protein